MREFRKKQKLFNNIMKPLVICSAIFIFLFIGAEPFIESWHRTAAMVISYFCDFLVIVNMCYIFIYYNKFGKSDSFLNSVEHELSDCGFYYTARTQTDEEEFIKAINNSLVENQFVLDSDLEVNDFDFSIIASKKNSYFYVADIEDLSRSDILAYIDTVVFNITVQKLKKKGSAVLCLVTNNAQEDAIALSKMITPIGKKEKLKIALCIVEPSTKRCYFLGNMQTMSQQMIVDYVLNVPYPIEDKYKGDKRIKFQDELEEHMKDFNIKDFKNGKFFAH